MKAHTLIVVSILAASSMSLFASSDTDRKIEETAKASYNYRTVLDNHVSVKANDGIVTLTGAVQDKDQKSLAADTVTIIPGVVQVINQITVDPAPAEHSDSWIALKLHMQLLVRADVSSSNTTINVKDGVVTLTGTAENMAQKELTGEYAKDIDWVKSVKNELVVQATPSTAKTVGEKIDDASITTQVKYALFTHRSTSALKTKIVTTDGVVVISGEAANDAEKSLVTKLTKSIRGVKSVTNDMTIKV